MNGYGHGHGHRLQRLFQRVRPGEALHSASGVDGRPESLGPQRALLLTCRRAAFAWQAPAAGEEKGTSYTTPLYGAGPSQRVSAHLTEPDSPGGSQTVVPPFT